MCSVDGHYPCTIDGRHVFAIKQNRKQKIKIMNTI